MGEACCVHVTLVAAIGEDSQRMIAEIYFKANQKSQRFVYFTKDKKHILFLYFLRAN